MDTGIRRGFVLLSGILCIGLLTDGTRTQALDWGDAADRLAKARFESPGETECWWQPGDGLPLPLDTDFPAAAASFLQQHPEPPPGEVQRGRWDTRLVASRQWKCLAYLSAAKGTANVSVTRLCLVQAESLQWTLPMRGTADQTLYAAVGAQSLLGQVLRDAIPPGSAAREAATQWLRTAAGQLATYGTKGDASFRNMAQALVDRGGIFREHHEGQTDDGVFFEQLDLMWPDTAEVARHAARSHWQAARAAYVQALAERFSARRGWPDVNHWRTVVDLPEADDICRNVFLLQAHMFRRYDFGPEVDWTKVIDDDIESRVWMNAHPWMWQLLNAYQASGDDKYIVHLCRLFNSWYDRSPTTFVRSSSQWRTLEAGGRAGQHQRCVFFVKGHYAVIADRVVGKGSHQVDVLFHPAPVVTGEGTQRTVRATKLDIRPDGSVVTRESNHANVAILPASHEKQQVLQLVGRKNPVRGWYALYGIVPSPDLVYRSQVELPAQFATVVQPLPPGDAEPMHVQPRDVTVRGGGPAIGVECGDDLFLLSYEGPTEMRSGEIAFHGTALLLRRQPDGARQAWMVDGRRLSFGDQQIFATDDPKLAASIELKP